MIVTLQVVTANNVCLDFIDNLRLRLMTKTRVPDVDVVKQGLSIKLWNASRYNIGHL